MEITGEYCIGIQNVALSANSSRILGSGVCLLFTLVNPAGLFIKCY